MKQRSFYYTCVPEGEREEQANQFRTLGAQETEIFIDIMPEKQEGRRNLRILKRAALREGDTLVIPALDCLSSSRQGIRDELAWLRDNRIRLKVIGLPSTMRDFPEPQDRIAQLVSELLVELYSTAEQKGQAAGQLKGTGKVRKAGARPGRPPMERGAQFEALKKQWESGNISLREAGRQLGVTHRTFGKWVTEEENRSETF